MKDRHKEILFIVYRYNLAGLLCPKCLHVLRYNPEPNRKFRRRHTTVYQWSCACCGEIRNYNFVIPVKHKKKRDNDVARET